MYRIHSLADCHSAIHTVSTFLLLLRFRGHIHKIMIVQSRELIRATVGLDNTAFGYLLHQLVKEVPIVPLVILLPIFDFKKP